jgi:hypothetical protein
MNILKKTALSIVDLASDLTTVVGVRDMLPEPKRREVMLNITPYVQTNSYACAAIAGWTVIKAFFPEEGRLRFKDFYAKVKPHALSGTTEARLVRALAAFGMQPRARVRLTIKQMETQIRKGRPVIVGVNNPGSECGHYCVVYGFSKKDILVSGNGLPFVSKHRITRERFRDLWSPIGNAIVCSPTVH